MSDLELIGASVVLAMDDDSSSSCSDVPISILIRIFHKALLLLR